MAKTDIWDLWQYNSPLSFHRTGLSWSAKKYTGWSTRKDGEFEEVQVVRIWDYAAGPWWLGLVVSGLRRAELPLSDAVPRPLSLSLSADHTLRPVTLGRWPPSVRPLSGQSQATLRPGHWAGRRPTRATLCKVLCPDTPSVTQYYGSCWSRLRPPPETSTLRPIFWVKSSQVGTFPIHPYTHPPGNHQVPRSRLFKPFQTNWKKPSLKRLTFEATIEDPSIQVIFQTFQNTITGNPFAFDNVSYPVQWRVFILIVIICHSDDDPIETNWVWISRFQRPVESQGWAAGRDDATSSMI